MRRTATNYSSSSMALLSSRSSLPSVASQSFVPPAPLRARQHGLRVRCSVSYDQQVPPSSIPPPPSPPPPRQDVDRRQLLQVAAFGGAGMLAGVMLGRLRQAPSISQEERQLIDQRREAAKFRRDYEGHVAVQARDGSWFEVKLDAKVPGMILLRDQDGFVYYQTIAAQQVDLTEDYVVAAIFGDGMWENNLNKLQGKDENGVFADAQFDQEAFRDLISITE